MQIANALIDGNGLATAGLILGAVVVLAFAGSWLGERLKYKRKRLARLAEERAERAESRRLWAARMAERESVKKSQASSTYGRAAVKRSAVPDSTPLSPVEFPVPSAGTHTIKGATVAGLDFVLNTPIDVGPPVMPDPDLFAGGGGSSGGGGASGSWDAPSAPDPSPSYGGSDYSSSSSSDSGSSGGSDGGSSSGAD